MENNREFKAVVQDMTHVYLGARMSVKEMTGYDDVPFKIKAIFNKYFYSPETEDLSIAEIIGSIDRDDFKYQVIKQLRLKFKVGEYEDVRGKRVYRSKTLTIDEFLDIHASDREYADEEIVFNKLALLAFST